MIGCIVHRADVQVYGIIVENFDKSLIFNKFPTLAFATYIFSFDHVQRQLRDYSSSS